MALPVYYARNCKRRWVNRPWHPVVLQQAGRGPYGSVLEFYSRSGMTADEFAQVADALTISADPYTAGLVNVNTASATVLACIPGHRRQ